MSLKASNKRAASSSSSETAQRSSKLQKKESTVNAMVFTVGSGDISQLGLGHEKTERQFPTQVQPFGKSRNATRIAAGSLHNVVLNTEGEAWSWGCDDEGAIGRQDDAWFAAKIVFPKENDDDDDVKVADVACGSSHTVFLGENAKVYACGTYRDNNGVLGFSKEDKIATTPREVALPLTIGEKAVAIASGDNHDLVLTNRGHVYEWGDVRLGLRQSRRLKTEKLTARQVRLPAKAKVHKIFTSSFSNYAVATVGNKQVVYAWGLNNYGQCGNGSTTNILVPTPVLQFADLDGDVVKIVGGELHALVLTSSRKVYSMGRGHYGRLGHGDEEESHVPREIATFSSLPDGDYVTDIGCGSDHSLAATNQGFLYTWGSGDLFQLGLGDRDAKIPTKVLCGQLTEVQRGELRTRKRHVLQADGGSQHSIVLALPNPDE